MLSVVVLIVTGNIKKELRYKLTREKYIQIKSICIKNLNKELSSMQKDNICTNIILSEIQKNISTLKELDGYLTRREKRIISRIEILLLNGSEQIDSSNNKELIINLSSLIGIAKADTYDLEKYLK